MSFIDLVAELARELTFDLPDLRADYDPGEPRDESGKWTGGGSEPVTLYHGTATGKPHEAHEGGYFLSPSENLAGVYGKVLKAQVRMSKPIDMRDKANVSEFVKKRKGKESIAAYAKRAGYDGVIDNNGSVIVLAPEQIVRADWDESQHPRGQPENAGEFAKGGGGGSAAKASPAKEPGGKGYEFVSPNIKEGTKLREARIGLKGTRHKTIVNMAREVDKALGVDVDVKPVIGMWADGAENSTMSVIDNPPWETLTASAAMKGWLAKQKQVLVFKTGDTDPTHGDEAGLASFSAKGKAEEISQWLGENALPYHTLEPTNGGFTVYVYGNDKETGEALTKAGEHYGSEVKVRRGRGAFLGTHKEDGSDADQRDDARAEYSRLLAQSGDDGIARTWKGIRDRYGRQADETVSDQTETPHFKAWFGDSKIVDADGQPQVMYHGTLGDFKSFDKQRAQVEGNWGAGFYFTNDSEDMSHNYAGHGPDAENKIESMADEIEGQDDFEGDHDEARRRAEKLMAIQHEGAAIPVFLKMEKPFKVGGKGETFLDYDSGYNPETEEEGTQSGKAFELVKEIRRLGQYEGFSNRKDIDRFADGLFEHITEGEGIRASELEDLARESDDLAYVEDENGKFASKELMRQALQNIGFDGIIDNRVSKKFHFMGLKPTSAHYIVFDPHQIKSAIGNRGTFDPKSTAITDSAYDSSLPPGLVEMIRADAYNPNEARIPKGQPGAGQWTSGGAGMGFTPAAPSTLDPDGSKVWTHPGTGGKLTVHPDGKWFFAGGNDNALEGLGGDEDSLNKFLYLHKDELEPKGGKLVKDLKDMGFKEDGIYGYTHVFSKDKHTFSVDARTGDWRWEHENGSTESGSGEYDMLATAGAYFPEADALLAKVPKPPPPAPADLTAMGFTKDTNQSSDSISIWHHEHAGTLKVQNATGKWKYGGDPDGTEAEGDDVKSMNKWLDQNSEELKPKPPPEPTEWKPNPEAYEVGGSDWNRKMGEKLEKEFVAVAPELDATADALYKDKTPVDEPAPEDEDDEDEEITPTTWEELSGDQQEAAESKWKENNLSSQFDSEVENWQSSGQPLHEAKESLAADGADAEYVKEMVDEMFDAWDQDGTPIPYTKQQVMNAIVVKPYHDKYDDGGSDPEFEFNDDELTKPTDLVYDPEKQGVFPGMEAPNASNHFTQEMRDDLEQRLKEEFDSVATNKAGNMDAPDYLNEQAEESLGEYWDQMDDESKFKEAENVLDFDEGKSAKSKPAEAVVDPLDHPPKEFDPLNYTGGANYKRTQAISHALSIQRGVDLLARRDLVKVTPRDLNETKLNIVNGIAGDSRLFDTIVDHLSRGVDYVDSLQDRKDLPGIKAAWLAAQFRQTASSMLAVQMKAGTSKAINQLAAKLAIAAHPHWEYGKVVTDWTHDPETKQVTGLTPEESSYVEKAKDNISTFVADAIDERADIIAHKAMDSPEKIKASVQRADTKLWRDWVSSSTSLGGKLIQIAAADELGGRLRLPAAPKLDEAPIKPVTQADIIAQAMPGLKKLGENPDATMVQAEDHGRPTQGVFAGILNALSGTKIGPADDKVRLAKQIAGLTTIKLDKDGNIEVEIGKIPPIPGDEKLPGKDVPVLQGTYQRILDEARERIMTNVRSRIIKGAETETNALRSKSTLDAKAKYGGWVEEEETPERLKEAAATPSGKNALTGQIGVFFDHDEGYKALPGHPSPYGTATYLAGKIKWGIEDGKLKANARDIGELLKDMPEARKWVEDHAPEIEKVAERAAKIEWAEDQAKKYQAAVAKYDSEAGDAWETKAELEDKANAQFADVGGYAGIKALMRAKWETTQWLLAKAGVHTMNVFRGINDDRVNAPDTERVPDAKGFIKLPQYNMLRNGAASTALISSVSNHWRSDHNRVVLRLQVPRTAAISVPSYGQNEHKEREVVVTGTAWKNWDAYKKTAPEFDEVPVERHTHAPRGVPTAEPMQEAA
jgi:hypothetical protein